jgi:hypothetical protein
VSDRIEELEDRIDELADDVVALGKRLAASEGPPKDQAGLSIPGPGERS